MSTDETSTQETVETTEGSASISVQELETKIGRFARFREVIVLNDQKWAEEHTAKRVALLEEAGLLEKFKELDAEVASHRSEIKTNLDPITASIQVLSAYRMSLLSGKPFDQMEVLDKVWIYEEQLFSAVEKAKTQESSVEEKEEKSEE